MKFKPVIGFPNYIIYEDGRVQNIMSGKFRKHTLDGHGYLYIHFSKDNFRKNLKIHRLLAETFIPNPENKPCINHVDGNKQNNSLGNLEWVTYSENNQHAFDIGLKNPTIITQDHKESIRKAQSKLVHWYHEDYGEYYCTALELTSRFADLSLSRGNLSSVSLGLRKQHKGWKLII